MVITLTTFLSPLKSWGEEGEEMSGVTQILYLTEDVWEILGL